MESLQILDITQNFIYFYFIIVLKRIFIFLNSILKFILVLLHKIDCDISEEIIIKNK